MPQAQHAWCLGHVRSTNNVRSGACATGMMLCRGAWDMRAMVTLYVLGEACRSCGTHGSYVQCRRVQAHLPCRWQVCRAHRQTELVPSAQHSVHIFHRSVPLAMSPAHQPVCPMTGPPLDGLHN